MNKVISRDDMKVTGSMKIAGLAARMVQSPAPNQRRHLATSAITRIDSLPTEGSSNSYCGRTESAIVTATKRSPTQGDEMKDLTRRTLQCPR